MANLDPQELFKALDKRYNDRWFSQQPAGARGFTLIENHQFYPLAIQPDLVKYNIELCRTHPLVGDIIVVTHYGVRALLQVPNPNWVGSQIIEAQPFDLQGRLAWRPSTNTGASAFEVATYYNSGVVYTNDPLKSLALPQKDGYISELGVREHPRYLVLQGQATYIEILLRDEGFGFTPPPPELIYGFIAEIRGYILPIPNFLTDGGR